MKRVSLEGFKVPSLFQDEEMRDTRSDTESEITDSEKEEKDGEDLGDKKEYEDHRELGEKSEDLRDQSEIVRDLGEKAEKEGGEEGEAQEEEQQDEDEEAKGETEQDWHLGGGPERKKKEKEAEDWNMTNPPPPTDFPSFTLTLVNLRKWGLTIAMHFSLVLGLKTLPMTFKCVIMMVTLLHIIWDAQDVFSPIDPCSLIAFLQMATGSLIWPN